MSSKKTVFVYIDAPDWVIEMCHHFGYDIIYIM